MHVGMALHLQNIGNVRSDLEVYANGLRLAGLAEPLGLQSIWAVEHHFTDYVLIPDPLFLLTYLAGRTSTVEWGTMGLVLPWHDPVRVVENVAMVDNISNGRLILGIGRGFGRVEFYGFGVPMGESRERCVEAAGMVVRGFEDGFIEGDGTFVPRVRRDIRPGSFRSTPAATHGSRRFTHECQRLMQGLMRGRSVSPPRWSFWGPRERWSSL